MQVLIPFLRAMGHSRSLGENAGSLGASSMGYDVEESKEGVPAGLSRGLLVLAGSGEELDS